jgi:hypothetical protein
MHGLSPKDKQMAYQKVKQRALDARIALSLEGMKESTFITGKDRDVMDRKTFKHLSPKDKKNLYREYGFSSSSSEDEEAKERVKSPVGSEK